MAVSIVVGLVPKPDIVMNYFKAHEVIMKTVFSLFLFILITILILLPIKETKATPPPQPNLIQNWIKPDDPFVPADSIRHWLLKPRRDMDNYIGCFISACRFLDDMQEHDENSDDFGGMHEGEGDDLWRIVQTDNTQEAIVDWCIYADFFDDPDTYHEDVEAAWIYNNNFPAWEEEGGDGYYRIHNSGWGLMAEMYYRNIYGDSQREYGTQCAEYIMEHTPDIEPNHEDALMPLAAGLGAGMLYKYGLFEENNEYLEAAVRISEQLKDWIDADPDRLNYNEVWALCGGTAMWGVLVALGHSDSATTAEWAVEPLERMDVFAGENNWNNSLNIWYAHAWVAAWKLLNSDEYQANVEIIVDSLLAQDHDYDGGIPATIGDGDDLDQSWVTAYTGWMGLNNLFEILPEFDARVVSLASPLTTRAYPVGEPLSFSIELLNAGAAETLDIPFFIRGGFHIDSTIHVEGWESQYVVLNQIWCPDEASDYNFITFSRLEEDANPFNDTLHFTIEILPVGNIQISTSNLNQESIGCLFEFYNLDIDSALIFREIQTDPQSGQAEFDLMIGNYRVEITPDFPYPLMSIDYFEVTEDNNPINLSFEQPPVLLIDRDADSSSTNFEYYETVLSDIYRPYRRLCLTNEVSLEGMRNGFHTLLYFTGDRESETLNEADQQEIANHLSEGGCLFITGQNISDDLADDVFLTNVLHARHLSDRISSSMVVGIENDQLFNGMQMLTIGNNGAANQTSRSGLSPVNGGITCAEYRDKPDTSAAIRWEEESGGKGVFFAFGFEAISGQGNTTTRAEVLTSIFDWFGTPSNGVSDDNVVTFPIAFSSIVYPNPTNGAVTIRFSKAFSQSGMINIFDLSGRLVRRYNNFKGDILIWDGADNKGFAVSSGVYIIQADQRMFGKQKNVGVVTFIR
ncbi:T9SS type A sorting domain-containing protein [bacterium]|nr:T9SS type A sorting domain-containing protein [bacterium]